MVVAAQDSWAQSGVGTGSRMNMSSTTGEDCVQEIEFKVGENARILRGDGMAM